MHTAHFKEARANLSTSRFDHIQLHRTLMLAAHKTCTFPDYLAASVFHSFVEYHLLCSFPAYICIACGRVRSGGPVRAGFCAGWLRVGFLLDLSVCTAMHFDPSALSKALQAQKA